MTVHDDLHVLDVDECLHLLATHPVHVGRVGFVDGGDLFVLPVNYRYDRGSVVFRSDDGSKLAVLRDGHRVAFEVDHVDPFWEEGWSVLMRGRVSEVADPDELAHLHQLGVRSWAGGEKIHYLRVAPSAITGRRIGQ